MCRQVKNEEKQEFSFGILLMFDESSCMFVIEDHIMPQLYCKFPLSSLQMPFQFFLFKHLHTQHSNHSKTLRLHCLLNPYQWHRAIFTCLINTQARSEAPDIPPYSKKCVCTWKQENVGIPEH